MATKFKGSNKISQKLINSIKKETSKFTQEVVEEKKQLHIMIGTPSYRGDLHVYYVNSLVQTIITGINEGIFFHPFWVSNDALVQRCRNDIFKIAYEEKIFDALLCIDADMLWDPKWAIELVKREEDIIGGTTRKKTDEQEMYVTGINDFNKYENGLMKAMSLGMGFVKVSRKVIDTIWESSPEYVNPGGRDSRLVFNIDIVDGELWGEDSIFWKKCREAGFTPWVDPKMTCDHVGEKIYSGNFEDYLKRTVNFLTAT